MTISSAILFTGCSSIPERPPVAQEMVWSTHEDRPAWTFTEVESGNQEISIVGISNRHSTEKMAREAAKLNALANASVKLGALVSKDSSIAATSASAAASTSDEIITGSTTESLSSKAIVKMSKVTDQYIEMWVEADGSKFYQAFVKLTFDAKKARTLVDQIAKI